MTRRSRSVTSRSPAVPRTLLVLASLLLSFAAAGSAQVLSYEAVVSDGDAYGGGTVFTIESVAVNDAGDWMVHARIEGVPNDRDEVLIKNGALVAQESDLVSTPTGGAIQRFQAFGLGAPGADARLYNLKNTTSPPLDDYAVFVNDALVIQDGGLVGLPGLSGTATWGNQLDLDFNVRGEFLVNGFIDDPVIPGSPDSALIRVNTGFGSSAVIVKEGDVLPGNPLRGVKQLFIDPGNTALNDEGDAIFLARLEGDFQTADVVYLVDDDQGTVLLAQMGDTAPGGGNYAFFTGLGLDVNNESDWVLQANRDDGVSILVKNGELFIAEGDPLPGLPGETLADLGTFSPTEIDDRGRVLWRGTYPNVNGFGVVFLEHEPIIHQAVTTFDGQLVTSIGTESNSYHVSPSGEWVIAEVALAPGGVAALLVHVQDDVCQTDLGFGGPGVATLSMCGGDLSTGTTADLALTGAAPNTPAYLFAGLAQNPTPFKGGQLVPVPFALVLALATDGDGALLLPGVPGGGGPFSVFLQFAIEDAAQPAGFALSNAIRADFLP